MKKIDSIILRVFLCGLPVIIVMAVLLNMQKNFQLLNIAAFLNDLIGIILMGWLILSVYLSIRLIMSEALREKVLSKLTLIKDRDEREERLTGKSMRATFLATIAILIILFFFSCLQFSIYKVDPQYAVSGKTGFVTIGFNLYLSDTDRTENNINNNIPVKKDIFSYKGLPVSNTFLILLLILWQIINYNLSMKRFLK
jgi:hypothetical protein